MVTITYFVHGTTFDNENKMAAGWQPGELSALGLRQAHELQQLMANRTFDAVISSDLKRAVDTATIVFGNKHTIMQDKRLRECNYGDWTGKPDSLFKHRLSDFITAAFPAGESMKDVEKRLRSLCEDLKKNYDGKHVALVAHQSPQLALEVITREKTWEQAIATDWRRTMAYQPGWTYTIA